jgi:hypothetical protein
MVHRGIALLVLGWSCAASSAAALEIGAPGDLLSVDVHAFLSQGFILTLENDYLTDNTTDGSLKFSEIGLNFSKNLTDDLSAGLQLFSQFRGLSGNYDVILDWFYLNYRFADWLGLRIGRLKIPFGLYNESNDIDSGRVPILLPQSVYPLQTRQFLFAQTGFELHGFARADEAGALEYRLYMGTIFIDPALAAPPGSPVGLQFDVHYIGGASLFWETPLDGLRIGGSLQSLRFDVTATIPGTPPILINNRSILWIASAEYLLGDLTLTAEYSRWRTKQKSDFPGASVPSVLQERAYAMATYRITSWLQTGAYYALFFPNLPTREGRANKQHDVAATLRFDINDYWLIKLEGHYMVGTAGLADPLRTEQPAALEPRWGAFIAKTTVYF